MTRPPGRAVRLLVVGDTLLDRDVDGRVERICPDAPAPVVDVAAVHDRPGGAGLAALMAARPGTEVTLATGLGTDAAGARVRNLLDGLVSVHPLLSPPTTPGKTRVRSRGQTLVRLDDAGHLLGTAVSPAAVPGDVDEAAFEALVAASDAVLVADYGGPVPKHPVVRAVLARHAGSVPLVWDPHPRGDGPVTGVRVVTPNRAEASGFDGGASTAGSLDHVAARLLARWRVHAVAVTDGAHGVVVADGAGDGAGGAAAAVSRCAAPPCPASVDTCGAGDRFAGAVALGLAHGQELQDAVRAATVDVSAWLTAGGVSSLVDPGPDVDLAGTGAAAEDVVARVRDRGGRVVATGGCFDVLHAGHLSLLEAARRRGDCLVVLLNSDASTRRLKGAGRPVHSAADRARLLEAMRCVDAVAVFTGDDPSATLADLRPDLWVKGGDYRVENLPEAHVVHSYGGRVEVVPFVAGHSTTSVLARVGGGAASPDTDG